MTNRLSRWLLLLSVTGLLFAIPTAASAAKPAFTCPATASGFERLDPDGWWDRTTAGFAEMGIQVYEEDGVTFTAEFEYFAVGAGFASAAEAQFFVKVIQWAGIDVNRNGYACMQDYPNTPGLAPFIFNGIDDRASVPG